MRPARRNERSRPLLASARAKDFLLQPPEQKALGQVLGVFMAIAASADIGVKGIPISATKLLQGSPSLRRILVRRSEHHAPMRGDKCGSPRLAFGTGIFRPHGAILANPASLLHAQSARLLMDLSAAMGPPPLALRPRPVGAPLRSSYVVPTFHLRSTYVLHRILHPGLAESLPRPAERLGTVQDHFAKKLGRNA